MNFVLSFLENYPAYEALVIYAVQMVKCPLFPYRLPTTTIICGKSLTLANHHG